jgi:fibro-slime domain-containing protein
MQRITALGLAASASLFVHCLPAHADTIGINYYTIAESDRDANNLAGGVFDNEVQNALGVNGLPVLNTAAYGCMSNCYNPAGAPTDVLPDGEITYWSPGLNNGGPNGSSDVTYTGSANVPLPFNQPYNFFPPNGTGSSDYNGFQAATLTGTIDAPSTEQISFTIGADDMAFAYLDGQIVCDLGGVHAASAGTCVTAFDISQGLHSLEVFFVDMNNSQSGLEFSVDTAGVTVSPIPEPTSCALFGAGLLSLVAFRRYALRRQGRRELVCELTG